MLPPPVTGDVYDTVPDSTTNRGSAGVLAGWNAVRWFWGGTAQQGWADLVNIVNIGPDTIV